MLHGSRLTRCYGFFGSPGTLTVRSQRHSFDLQYIHSTTGSLVLIMPRCRPHTGQVRSRYFGSLCETDIPQRTLLRPLAFYNIVFCGELVRLLIPNRNPAIIDRELLTISSGYHAIVHREKTIKIFIDSADHNVNTRMLHQPGRPGSQVRVKYVVKVFLTTRWGALNLVILSSLSK